MKRTLRLSTAPAEPKIEKVKAKLEKVMFGAGCFWGVEASFRKLRGVKSATVGYSGGAMKDPTYEDVCSGRTGHAEVVQVEYDPSEISFDKLLDLFWEIHDPTTLNRQGPDVGAQYRSAIFFGTPEQEKAARASKEKLEKRAGPPKSTAGPLRILAGRQRPVVTQIQPAGPFYRAEEYHQRYLEKKGINHC